MTTYECLRAASQGDREQLAAFAAHALNNVMIDPLRAEIHLSEAATFARLAVMHGEAEDMQILAGILLIQAQLCTDHAALALQGPDEADEAGYYLQAEMGFKAEAIHWLNAAVDAGSSDALDYLMMLGEAGVDREAFAIAKRTTAEHAVTIH